MHWFNSIKIGSCFCFITPDLNFSEQNPSEPFCSCTENWNYKCCQADKHDHNISTVRKYPHVNNPPEISLITTSEEAPYQKALWKGMVRRKEGAAYFSSACILFYDGWTWHSYYVFPSLEHHYHQCSEQPTASSQLSAPAASSYNQRLSVCDHRGISNGITGETRQTSASSSSLNKGWKTLPTSAVLCCSPTTLCASHGFSDQGFAVFQ